jgi:hypothetical protein
MLEYYGMQPFRGRGRPPEDDPKPDDQLSSVVVCFVQPLHRAKLVKKDRNSIRCDNCFEFSLRFDHIKYAALVGSVCEGKNYVQMMSLGLQHVPTQDNG